MSFSFLFHLLMIACMNVGQRSVQTESYLLYHHRRQVMAKGMQQKKTAKKKPTKTLMEKRAEKSAKKGR